jgi:hypothetical protein
MRNGLVCAALSFPLLCCSAAVPEAAAQPAYVQPESQPHPGGTVVRVRVQHGENAAPAGIEVRLYSREVPSAMCGTSRRRMAPLARTDATGWANFKGVRAGTYALRLESPTLGFLETTVAVPAGDTIVVRYAQGGTRSLSASAAEARPSIPGTS